MVENILIPIVLDGASNVGKTSIFTHLGHYKDEIPLIPTTGLNFRLNSYSIFNKAVNTLVWDLAGRQKFNFLREGFYKRASCMILVCDITLRKTYKRFDYFIELADECKIRRENIILCANKADLEKRRNLSSNKLKELVKHYNLSTFIEISARSGTNVDILFEYATVLGLHAQKRIKNTHFEFYKKNLEEIIKFDFQTFPKKKRKCWVCHKTIYYDEFLASNNYLKNKRLRDLWNSKYLEFYCCSCYKEKFC